MTVAFGMIWQRTMLRKSGLLLLLCVLSCTCFKLTGGSQGGGGGIMPLPDQEEPRHDQPGRKPDPNDSLEKLLHWAIEHSDQQALRDGALEKQRLQQVSQEDQDRQPPLQEDEIMEHSKIRQSMDPSETELIQEVVAMLTSESGLPAEETRHALEALQVLVEPIDNANNMKVLGGIPPVVEQLEAQEGNLRALAAYVLGTAASNNPHFQNDLLELYPDIFSRLRQLLLDTDDEVCNKGLYAVGALVRNQRNISHDFLAGGGLGHLEALMVLPRAARITRKALSVAMDILEVDNSLASLFLGGKFTEALLQLLHVPDLDLQEKALGALEALLKTNHPLIKEAFQAHNAEEGLLRLRANLLHGVTRASPDGDSDGDGYLSDVLQLCSSVLGMLSQSSTESSPHRTEL